MNNMDEADAARLLAATGFNLQEQAELILMVSELVGGREKFGRYQTRHEALGVILEEFDEFKAEIYGNDTAAAIKEARQVAATALRFCMEFTER